MKILKQNIYAHIVHSEITKLLLLYNQSLKITSKIWLNIPVQTARQFINIFKHDFDFCVISNFKNIF